MAFSVILISRVNGCDLLKATGGVDFDLFQGADPADADEVV
jgi:hypothetical protein